MAAAGPYFLRRDYCCSSAEIEGVVVIASSGLWRHAVGQGGEVE